MGNSLSKEINKYENGSIYMLYCQYGDIRDRYYGSTTQELHKRLYEHKHTLDCSSKILIEKYGEDNIIIELVEPYPCKSRVELRAREGFYIRNNECVNKRIEGRSRKEWIKDNSEVINAKNAKYRAEHKEDIKAYKEKYIAENPEKKKANNSKYRAENPEKIKTYQSKYRVENPEKIKAKQAKYRAENPEKIKANQAKYRAEQKAKKLLENPV